MNKLFCDICGKEMQFYPCNFLAKKIGEIHTRAKIRGKGTCAHVVRSGKTIERYIFLYATAKKTGEYGGENEEIDICHKCVQEIIRSSSD